MSNPWAGKRVLFNSTDKVVNPTSVMGTSKLMCERLISAANAQRRGDGPVLASSRFGRSATMSGPRVCKMRRSSLSCINIAARPSLRVTWDGMNARYATVDMAWCVWRREGRGGGICTPCAASSGVEYPSETNGCWNGRSSGNSRGWNRAARREKGGCCNAS